MLVSAIVAASDNFVIGIDNNIPWYLSEDFKFFKRTTLHHHIIMGRNTYQSIGRSLPKRTNVILTRNPFFTVSNCLVTHSIQDALEMAYDNGETEAFIIGGGEIYKQAWSYLDRIYLTHVHTNIENGQVFFPEPVPEEWDISVLKTYEKDEKNDFDFTVKLYERKNEA